jgi:hypothetical protein
MATTFRFRCWNPGTALKRCWEGAETLQHSTVLLATNRLIAIFPAIQSSPAVDAPEDYQLRMLSHK